LVLLVRNKNTIDFSISGFGMHIVLKKNGAPDEVVITPHAVKHHVHERRESQDVDFPSDRDKRRY